MKKILKLIFLSLILILITGCSISFKGLGENENHLGVYKTVNQGAEWTQSVALKNTKGLKLDFGTANITALEIDPSDYRTIYAGTKNNGLFYSYDQGASWQRVSLTGWINSIQVDPSATCTIYVAMDNKIYKTDNCSRSWEKIYVENKPNEYIKSLAVDHQNNKNVYAGTTTGTLLKSVDFGNSWTAIYRFPDNLKKIALNKKNPQIIYTGIKGNGLYKSNDGGVSWRNFSDQIKDYKSSQNYYDFILDDDKDDSLIYASKFGLLKSDDGGENWSQIKLLTKEGSTRIYRVVINPKNSQNIYYSTNKNFYRSDDGGMNWQSQNLPFSRLPYELIIDFENPEQLYLGAFKTD